VLLGLLGEERRAEQAAPRPLWSSAGARRLPAVGGAGDTVDVSVAAGAVYAGPREKTRVDALLAAADTVRYAVERALVDRGRVDGDMSKARPPWTPRRNMPWVVTASPSPAVSAARARVRRVGRSP
jgi:hypothetical protein